jgi:hypothetical protein
MDFWSFDPLVIKKYVPFLILVTKFHVRIEQRVKIVGFVIIIIIIIIILLFLNNWILNNVAEYLGHVVSTSASCWESLGFKSLHINQLHWLPFSVFSSVQSRQSSCHYVKLSRDIWLLHPSPFTMRELPHHSTLYAVSSDAIWSTKLWNFT